MTSLRRERLPKTLGKWLSADNLTQKAYLNALAMLLDRGVRFAIGFFINPLMVNGLGDYLFGTWQILARMTTYFSAASGRPTQALTWIVANQQASTDYEEKRRGIGSALGVSLLFLPLLVLIGAVLAWFTPGLLNAPPALYWQIRVTTALLIINLAITDVADIPQSVLRGENLGYKRVGLSTILVIIGGVLTALALYLDTGLIGIAAANIATTVLTGALFVRIVRTYVPWFGIARPAWKEVRQFLRLSGWFLVWFLVLQLIRNSDVIILGVLDSAETVTVYTLSKYIPETLTTMIFVIVGAVTPGLGGIIGNGELERATAVRSEIMILTWLITVGVGTAAIAWDQTFLGLWVGREYYAGSVATMLIVLMVAQFVLIQNDARVIDLTLDIRQKVLVGLLASAISLATAGVALQFFDGGIVGLCLGFIIGRLILSIGYPIIVGRFLHIPMQQQFAGAVRPAIVMSIFFVGAWGLSYYASTHGFFAADTWIGLAVYASGTCCLTFLLAFYAGLTAAQRSYLWRRVHRSLPKS